MKIITHVLNEMNAALREKGLDFTLSQDDVVKVIQQDNESWIIEDLIPLCYDNEDAEMVRDEIANSFEADEITKDLRDAIAAVVQDMEADDNQVEDIEEAMTNAFVAVAFTLNYKDKEMLCEEFTDIIAAHLDKVLQSYNEYKKVDDKE